MDTPHNDKQRKSLFPYKLAQTLVGLIAVYAISSKIKPQIPYRIMLKTTSALLTFCDLCIVCALIMHPPLFAKNFQSVRSPLTTNLCLQVFWKIR